MSHYGGQILYHIVNRHPSWALSRCYHPWTDAEQLMRARGIPLFSLEYMTPVRDADWIGFSVNYELQYANLVNMLDLAGLPPYSRDRTQGFPLVVTGGSVMGNPEPLADFVDACVVGDGEEAVVSICGILEKAKRGAWSKTDALAELAKIRGVYVPAFHPATPSGMFLVPDISGGPVRAAKIKSLSDDSYPGRPIVPLVNVVHHRLVVEVLRGCSRGCRFCAAGYYYRPVRERPAQNILPQASEGIAHTGWRDIGLLSLSTADYSELGPLLRAAADFAARGHVSLSLPSTRIDALDKTDLDSLQAIAPFSSFTLAPEAGTQRLRNAINKGFTDAQIVSTVSTLLKRGVQTIKLYFMIGLPGETDDDIAGIVKLVEEIGAMAWRQSHRVGINVALSPFSPKPHTPFQWEPMEGADTLLAKARRIKNALVSLRNVKTSYRDPKMAFLETVLARGDRSLSACIRAAWEAGARFDGWDEHFDLARWTAAAQSCGIVLEKFLGGIALSQTLPWSVVSTGVSASFLLSERNNAAAGTTTADCRTGACSGCGVCETGASRMIRAVSPQHETLPDAAPGAKAEPGTKHCFRFLYKKDPSIRFLGHLDMMGVILRALRTARVSLAFSEGCRPHPLVSFGPPLSLGIAADAELFDVTATSLPDNPIEEINKCLPEGLAVLAVSEIPGKHVSLNADICAGSYVFLPTRTSAQGGIGPGEMAAAVQSFLSASHVTINVVKEGSAATKDIRPLVYSLEAHESVGDRPMLAAVLSMEPGRTCKAFDLLTALFAEKSCWEFLVTRKECLRKEAGALRSVWKE